MPILVRVRPTPWSTVILLCRKCSGKMKGGYGRKGKETLRTALRAELTAKGHKRGVRILETRCIGICPKKAVTALNASRPGKILIIPKGTGADEALARLVDEGQAPSNATPDP
ncbi:(2Fe-2S) ferredoxin domain-containing protein [Acidisphaera sp. S103]|uniref:(2Fe-2S) ferredoxin domain-containing protein n=1 Tax=Acidisphaera sp. S103 TaxID=1747223 RepID=UPI00131D50BD|nr:(2Fe-2S) ferredoxin domain-containing protein [Acidisphaera sp. S103]